MIALVRITRKYEEFMHFTRKKFGEKCNNIHILEGPPKRVEEL